MQCPACQRRVKRNKNGTIPRHYVEESRALGWAQKQCSAVGTADGHRWTAAVPANASTMQCPCCGARVGKKKDGRMRAHQVDGRECPASIANR